MEHSWIFSIITGGIAGWLAGLVMNGTGFGIFADIIIGIVGGFIGSWVMGLLGVHLGSGYIGHIIVALIGAVILLFIVKQFKRA